MHVFSISSLTESYCLGSVCRELFDTENEAARAYDTALWRLKPREARNYANFKDTCPPDVAEMLASLEKVCSHLGCSMCRTTVLRGRHLSLHVCTRSAHGPSDSSHSPYSSCCCCKARHSLPPTA